MNRIPYPAHSGGSEAQQLAQLRSYLYQLADQLNLALEAAQTRAVVPIAGEKTQVQQVLPALHLSRVRTILPMRIKPKW